MVILILLIINIVDRASLTAWRLKTSIYRGDIGGQRPNRVYAYLKRYIAITYPKATLLGNQKVSKIEKYLFRTYAPGEYTGKNLRLSVT